MCVDIIIPKTNPEVLCLPNVTLTLMIRESVDEGMAGEGLQSLGGPTHRWTA